MRENELSKIILDVAIYVHKKLGPGLFESVYEGILAYELVHTHGLKIERQKVIPVPWRGIEMEFGFRADIIVEGLVLIELKSIEDLAHVHSKQVLTYLRLTGLKLGLLINFNEELLKDGYKRIVNHLED